jgi:hypothetical protein
MGMVLMGRTDEEIAGLVDQAREGDLAARNELLACFRQRLKRMVRLRLNRQLQGRVDESDIVQEALFDVVIVAAVGLTAGYFGIRRVWGQ